MPKNPYIRSVLSAVMTGVLVAAFILVASHAAQAYFSHKKMAAIYASASAHVPSQKSLLAQAQGVVDLPGINEEEPAGLDEATTAIVIEPISANKHPRKPISADAYFVKDMASSTVLFEKDSDRALPIASLTKLVTAVVGQTLYGVGDKVKITPAVLATEGNTGHFRLDELFSISDIIHPLILVSSNDAAEAIARSYKPGRKPFIKAMNDWVYSIGAYHTYFDDPSGLSPKNISSADDVATILEWIYKNRPDLISILHMKTYASHTHIWVNKTHFLNLSSYIAGKNGYIPEAKETAVGLFNINNRMYSLAVLGTKNRDKDVLELLQWITDSGKI